MYSGQFVVESQSRFFPMIFLTCIKLTVKANQDSCPSKSSKTVECTKLCILLFSDFLVYGASNVVGPLIPHEDKRTTDFGEAKPP